MNEIFASAVTLFLIMDPLGNIPIFLSILDKLPEERRKKIIVRELFIALGLMILFLFAGSGILKVLGLSQEAVAIGGGLVLMIIAIRMIFPNPSGVMGDEDGDGEPFIVPLAVPMMAGPSILATLILLVEKNPEQIGNSLLSLLLAWGVSATILYFSTSLYKVLGKRGLKAIERLMGMILITVSVQMLLTGFKSFMG